MTNSNVTLVSPKRQNPEVPYDYLLLLGELSRQLNFTVTEASGLDALLISLMGATTTPDLILFDVEIFNNKKSSVCEIINMISTAISISSVEKVPVLGVMYNYSYDKQLMSELHSTEIKGYVLDNFVEATGVIRTLLEGHTHKITAFPKVKKSDSTNSKNEVVLTARQQQVLKLVCNRGLSNKAIAKMLTIGESTVKIHMSAILKAYGVKNRTQLALLAGNSLIKN